MPECEICEKTQVKTYQCKECGKNFCVSCGKSHKKICKTCSEKNSNSRAGSPLNLISGIITGFRMKK